MALAMQWEWFRRGHWPAVAVGGSRGDLEALLAVLDPEIVLRVHFGDAPPGGTRELRGPRAAAGEAIRGAVGPAVVRPAVVNGAAGLVALDATGRPVAVLAFTVARGRAATVDVLVDPGQARQAHTSSSPSRSEHRED